MAVSKIWAIHSTPEETLKYISRPDKSENGSLVFSHHCSNVPELAALQMKTHRNRFGKDNGILLHHGFVSFKKDEVDRETAYKFAKTFMDKHFSDYQYFGSIHVDTEHIHFNFAINAVALEGHKYNGCKKNLAHMRDDVDKCCEELGLSIVIPKGRGVSYKEWMEERQNNSWKSQVRVDIDMAIEKANSFEDFLKILRNDGYYIKQGDNVKYMLLKKEGMARGCRCTAKKLGLEYTEEAIKERIMYKDFGFIFLKSELRKPRKKMKPVEKELMRIYYRKPTISNNIAMGVHLLNSYLTGNKHKITRYSQQKKKHIQNQYQKEIEKLSSQMNFCYENHIKTRVDLHNLIKDLKQKMELTHSAEVRADLKKKIKTCNEIEKSLNEIRDRDIVNNFEEKTEKDVLIVDKKNEQKER